MLALLVGLESVQTPAQAAGGDQAPLYIPREYQLPMGSTEPAMVRTSVPVLYPSMTPGEAELGRRRTCAGHGCLLLTLSNDGQSELQSKQGRFGQVSLLRRYQASDTERETVTVLPPPPGYDHASERIAKGDNPMPGVPRRSLSYMRLDADTAYFEEATCYPDEPRRTCQFELISGDVRVSYQTGADEWDGRDAIRQAVLRLVTSWLRPPG